MELIEATISDIPAIQALSDKAWPHTFRDLLSPDQIVYMMEMMYSTESLKKQLSELNHHYLLAKDDDGYLGYVSYEVNYKNSGLTKVHKIYIDPEAQGKGVGRFFIEYVSVIARNQNSKGLSLNVNKYNENAIGFYRRMGFDIHHSEENDIGDGFIMDDYVMNMEF